MKLHQSRSYIRRDGITRVTTTLCGRMSGKSMDGMNIADTDEQVNCKFCLRLMARTMALETTQ